MEERLAAASVDRFVGRSAYHALTYGWLMSGLARAVTGKGMRELFRDEISAPLDTDGLHLGRPPAGAPTAVAETLVPQSSTVSSVFDFIVPKLAALPYSGMLGTLYSPGVLKTLQGDMSFLDAEIPSANGVLTARGLAKAYGAIAHHGSTAREQFLSRGLVQGLAGVRSYSPDLNVGVPMSFHLGYHGSPVPGLLPGFGHSGLGGSVGWADPVTGSAFGFVHNRFITPMVCDQSSFIGLAVLLRRAVAKAEIAGVAAVPDFGAPYRDPSSLISSRTQHPAAATRKRPARAD
jgi:CubicO group peptidase (beta-lactamase class C family)